MKYYIYQREMGGDDYRLTNNYRDLTPIIIEAETKEEAEKIYLKDNEIDDEDAWLFYAVDVKSEEKFKCEECGKLFGYPKIVKESRGEYWGIPCHEDVAYCPHCGGWDFHEVEQEVTA